MSEEFQKFIDRENELIAQGMDSSLAFGKSALENRIANWPSGWGDDLVVIIFGDFFPPENDLLFESFGITIHKEKQDKTIVGKALCVLKATVKIPSRTVDSLIEASSRINNLLGILSLVGWGNGAIGWWSYVTHGTGGGVIQRFNFDEIDKAITGFNKLPATVKKKVSAALYWIREPRSGVAESHKRDIFRVYSGYWNAFECLVEAIDIVSPQPRISKTEKQTKIDEFVASKSGRLKSADISFLHQNVVNPGLVGKASHALKVCFQDLADKYITQCFKRGDKHNRLYDIRNAINHGEIEAENLDEILRVEARIKDLWMIVWGMFGRIIPFPTPVDTKP